MLLQKLHIRLCIVLLAMLLCAEGICVQNDIVAADNINLLKNDSIIVSQDGTGNFRSIQEAINSLPKEATAERVIFIKKGVYKEKIFIESNFITLKGESPAETQLVFSEARDVFRCDHRDDWGVATLNLKGNDITLESLTIINEYGFETKADISIPCSTDSVTGTKLVKTTGHQMALRSFETTRLIARNCIFKALGGDTVSPWNKEDGMFYFVDCVMEGGVDFYCPRGWALAENCQFICHNMDAAIWHDGSAHQSSKTVLLNCSFKGDDGFKLGRFHRDAQFYLINCRFPNNMADADIYQKIATPPNVIQWGKRVYYYNCHREGGDFDWHKNNFPDSLSVNDINRPWVYDYKWNPAKDKTTDDSIPGLSKTGMSTDPVAENMLLYQRKNGGWPKHFQEEKVDYKKELTNEDKKELKAGFRDGIDATIDNEATTKEIRYLAKAYKGTNNILYLKAATKGIDYLLEAQYKNGGWPQYYPDNSSYRNEITYNDNAMVNVLNVLQDIVEKKNGMEVIDPQYIPKCEKAVERGIYCILKTQVKRKKQLTAWCAQYDPYTLQPAKARKFELPSLSGAESVGITRFLMRLDNPSPAIIASVTAAVNWFEKVQIKGIKFIDIQAPKERSGRDRVVVLDSSSVLWARFYDLDNDEPFFTGRDGVAHRTIAEVENERRIGYAWYGTWPQKLLSKEYPQWLEKWGKKN